MSHTHRDLVVWQEAKGLAVSIYKISESFPKHEIYGLTSQIRRAAVSIVSNIAEGQGRLTRGEFVQFLGQARGSLLELLTQLEIAVALGYVSIPDFTTLEIKASTVLRLLNGLMGSIRAKTKTAGAT
ncbi:MAG: four helix bundle protein [Acidobacteria bacterium]|nr:four helix bundle protein [Acidobacteriota bacterium]MBV9144399.1 four helix bundle protein [Acidobacteriota bacterium]MBV9436811.1 four helix bundle protein [Acidobacteriota bacterium]